MKRTRFVIAVLLLVSVSGRQVSAERVVQINLLLYEDNPHFSSFGYASVRDAGGAELPVLIWGTHGIEFNLANTSWSRFGHYSETLSVGGISPGTCGRAWLEVTGDFQWTQFVCYQLNITTCPIVIDLQGDGFRFSGLEDAVWFDIDADLEPEEIGWTAADSLDGFLVLDRNGNGVVDDGRELFGNATPLGSGENATNGYEALAELDRSANGGNENGHIDRADSQFRRLRIWVDLNHDGRSQPIELKPLRAHGIEDISLSHTKRPITDEYGNVLLFFSPVSLQGGPSETTVLSTDVFFVTSNV